MSVALVVVVGVARFLPTDAPLLGSQLTLWTVMLLLYTLLTCARFRGADARTWADVADRQTRPPDVSPLWWWTFGRGTVQAISYVGVAGSVGVVAGAFVLPSAATVADRSEVVLVVLSVTTVATSWLSVHLAYAVHYATTWHHRGEPVPGLEFPGTPEPRLSDFVYFAFTIGMTAGTTDVAVTSTRMRRRVLLHSALSFGYNSVLVALVLAVVIGLV